MSWAILRSGDIGLFQAVEIIAANCRLDWWESSELTPDEADQLAGYQFLKDRFDENQTRLKAAAPGTLAALGNVLETNAPYDAPEATNTIRKAETKEQSRNNLLMKIWHEVRQALADGRLRASCMVEYEGNVDVPAHVWMWKANTFMRIDEQSSRLIINRVIILSKDNSGKPRVGTPFLRESDAKSWPTNSKAIASPIDADRKLPPPHELLRDTGRSCSPAALERVLASAHRFMADKEYLPLTKTEAQEAILRKIFPLASRDSIREATQDITVSKRRPPGRLVNRDQELADCRDLAAAATIA